MRHLSHIHRFIERRGSTDAPLLLLHGTGGDESDLLDLGTTVAPGASLLSPRGKVLENGMPRFFRRLREGVFDEEDLVRRAGELATFVAEAREAYGLAAPVALGFSNGANIAAALLMLHPGVLAGAVLLRAMTPLRNAPDTNLTDIPVLIVSGAADQIARASDAENLASQLVRAGAAVTHKTIPAGHGLVQSDLSLTRDWLASRALQHS